jgi:hypothetical protein
MFDRFNVDGISLNGSSFKLEQLELFDPNEEGDDVIDFESNEYWRSVIHTHEGATGNAGATRESTYKSYLIIFTRKNFKLLTNTDTSAAILWIEKNGQSNLNNNLETLFDGIKNQQKTKSFHFITGGREWIIHSVALFKLLDLIKKTNDIKYLEMFLKSLPSANRYNFQSVEVYDKILNLIVSFNSKDEKGILDFIVNNLYLTQDYKLNYVKVYFRNLTFNIFYL